MMFQLSVTVTYLRVLGIGASFRAAISVVIRISRRVTNPFVLLLTDERTLSGSIWPGMHPRRSATGARRRYN